MTAPESLSQRLFDRYGAQVSASIDDALAKAARTADPRVLRELLAALVTLAARLLPEAPHAHGEPHIPALR